LLINPPDTSLNSPGKLAEIANTLMSELYIKIKDLNLILRKK
jgi:hypothetical protein